MFTLFILAFVVYIIYKIFSSLSKRGGSSGASRAGSSTVSSPPKNTNTYRPAARKTSGIDFGGGSNSGSTASSASLQKELDDLCDAFTGEKLDSAKGLYRCERCKVYYHNASYEVLRSENSGACVACGAANLIAVSIGNASTSRGRNYDPSIVTLANIKAHVGRVVTFEGYVHSVKASRRGTDYAVMFEPKAWASGFKLVFFRGAANKVGGAAFINGLNRRTVKVRGLVVDHPTFGLEIIVSERSMILSIQ